MIKSLKEFIVEWNRDNRSVSFSSIEIPVVGRPAIITVRYCAAKYQDILTCANWNRLNDIVDAKSRGVMFVSTTQVLFERGIFDISVAAANHNYDESYLVAVLKWIGEEFFSTATPN